MTYHMQIDQMLISTLTLLGMQLHLTHLKPAKSDRHQHGTAWRETDRCIASELHCCSSSVKDQLKMRLMLVVALTELD